MSNQYYTLSEASLELNMPSSKVRQMVKSGSIETVDLPGGWKRFSREELERVKKTKTSALV